MSTKESVASPKWSEVFNSFLRSKALLLKCEVNVRYIKVLGLRSNNKKVRKWGPRAQKKLLKRSSPEASASADANMVNRKSRGAKTELKLIHQAPHSIATLQRQALLMPPRAVCSLQTHHAPHIIATPHHRTLSELSRALRDGSLISLVTLSLLPATQLLTATQLLPLTQVRSAGTHIEKLSLQAITLLLLPTKETMLPITQVPSHNHSLVVPLNSRPAGTPLLKPKLISHQVTWLDAQMNQTLLTRPRSGRSGCRTATTMRTTPTPTEPWLLTSLVKSQECWRSTAPWLLTSLVKSQECWRSQLRPVKMFRLTLLSLELLNSCKLPFQVPQTTKQTNARSRNAQKKFISKNGYVGTLVDEKHLRKLVKLRLRRSNDIETNPGPPTAQPETKLILLTQNCRGISDERKLKHLLNNSYKLTKSTANFIIALQETMITSDQRLRFGWRGSYVFTPGSGHGRGCVTLLPTHVQPVPNTLTHFGQRGHVFKATIDQNSAVIANVYSPNGHNRDKIDFIKGVKEAIEVIRDPNDDVYLMGDLNTVFAAFETHCRSFSNQEQRCSMQIKQIIDSLALEDIWTNNRTAHTWRQSGTKKSSRLDRIYFSHNWIKKNEVTVDWTFTNSDHGAIIATFTDGITMKRTRPLRLNPELLKSSTLANSFLQEYTTQLQQIPNYWNPHLTLEFHKCAIRNAYLKINSEDKKRQKLDFDFLKEDLHEHISALEKTTDTARSNRLMNKINQLKAKISKLNLERGTALANKLKTKWYNEGERSNKYFLSLLRKRDRNGQLTELEVNNNIITDETEIEKHVTDFYTQLYNQPQRQVTQREKDELLGLLEPLNPGEVNAIMSPLTKEMLHQTLKNTQDSCPGPDGIPYSYLKATWEWFGPALLRAWEYSQQTRTLAESHKTSWLRLIPKAGKNIKDLKNWRPITLSNCDHKLITKTLSKVMSDNIERVISGNQTAYLRQRSISDNLRIISLANKLAKKDERLKGLLIALDAKKAFDSVNHQYIRDILNKIGLNDLIPTFDLLYEESQVDIMINDKLCKGYNIRNGVKQGDALSCTLFILAMEPLIRNIAANQDIETLRSPKYKVNFPKCIGYADDISILTTDRITCVRAAIREYEKFTKVSGLQLNADKTEIFNLSSAFRAKNYKFVYEGQDTTVTNLEEIKVNGLLLASDPDDTHRRNFEEVKRKMDKQFAAWSNRGLSLLGKILIYKTFALSQIIYTARVIKYTDKEHAELRNLIYKFLWNRNYHGSKAPDRIKRSIMTQQIKDGGFGMVDHEKVIEAMNTKQILVNLEGTHPIRTLLEVITVDLSSSFNSKMIESLDGRGEAYCEAMQKINTKLLNRDLNYLLQDRIAKDMLLNEKLKNVTRRDRRHCIELTLLRNQGKTTVRQLLTDANMTNHFRLRILHYSYSVLMDACILSADQDPVNDRYVYTKGRYKTAKKITSREIRCEIGDEQNPDGISFKIPTAKEHVEAILPILSKLRCTKMKSLALRLIHGDIFTGVILLRFGMKTDDECTKCRQRETLDHLLNGCWYSGLIWRHTRALYIKTDLRRQNYEINGLEFVIGSKLSQPKLKLHLEIIRRLTHKDRPSILPKMLIRQSLDYLIICDTKHFKYYKRLLVALLETNT